MPKQATSNHQQPATAPHVLLIGINYWPEETGIAPYTTRFAEHLAATGRRVTVLTGMPHYPYWSVPADYQGKLWQREERNGVSIIRARHYVPSRQSAMRRALYEATFLLHTLSLARLPRPDTIVSVVPSLSGGVLASLASDKYRVPFGLIFQDLMGNAAAQSGMPGGGRVAAATRALERWMIRRAAGVGIVSEGFRTYIESCGAAPDRVAFLPNWSHIQSPTAPREETRARLGWSCDTQVALHAGNMGLKQGLEHVVAAAREAATTMPHLRFVLMGDGNQRARLRELGRDCPNLTFLPPQPAADFPNILAAADVLLVNERQSVTDMALPSKLTSYFVAGRPVVAAVAPGGTTAREVERSGAGMVILPESPIELIGALEHLWTDHELADRYAFAGPGFVTKALNENVSLHRLGDFVSVLYRPDSDQILGSEAKMTHAGD